jgi:protein ImuB
MRRILCLHLPNWPIQRLLAERPALDPRQPLVLFARDGRQRQLVVACNRAAAGHGVRRLMPLPEADALIAPREKHYAFPWDEAADLAALARLAEHCERFSPLVGWQTATQGDARRSHAPERRPNAPERASTACDFLLLDVTGIGVLFGGEEALARAVLEEFSLLTLLSFNGEPKATVSQRSAYAFGYTLNEPSPCVAVADTVGAAWALAVATPEKAPAPIVLPPGDTAALANLPLACLRLPAETLDLLKQLGLTQLDQLLQLPRSSLTSRFGERLLWRLDQLLGAAQETIIPHRPPPEFSAERCLEFPAESRGLIEQVIHELIHELTPALAERQRGAVDLTCRLDAAPGRPALLRVGLFRPSADPHHLWDLLRMQLEQTALSGPVGRFTLAAPLTAPLENRQRQLFAGNTDEAARQGELLIDRLSSRLGADAVLKPRLMADPVPERSVRCQPAVETRKRAGNFPSPPAPLHRPLLLASPPIELEVLALAPNGPPASFRWAGEQHIVAHYFGPERIESGWFRGQSIRRDYYRVETKSGQRYWLFRRLPAGTWFLHGEFG